MAEISLADPHCHTDASDGMVTPAELVAAAAQLGLGLIAITDHDTMANASEVRARGEAAGIAVVMGEEVTTRPPASTHVLGWFLERSVPSSRSLEWTVEAIHDQGGLAVIPHPFMPVYFASCQPGMLRRLLERTSVDGIETWFTAPTTGRGREALRSFYAANRDRLGAAIGSSDSHLGIHDLGRVLTTFPGRTAADFRKAVLEGTTEPRLGTPRPRPPLELLARQQVRGLITTPWRRLTGKLG